MARVKDAIEFCNEELEGTLTLEERKREEEGEEEAFIDAIKKFVRDFEEDWKEMQERMGRLTLAPLSPEQERRFEELKEMKKNLPKNWKEKLRNST